MTKQGKLIQHTGLYDAPVRLLTWLHVAIIYIPPTILFQGNRRLIERDQLDNAVEEVIHNDQWTGMFRVNYEKLCNMDRCKKMAHELYKAGEKKLGTDEEVFNRIFSTQDYYTLRMVWDQYVKVGPNSIHCSDTLFY